MHSPLIRNFQQRQQEHFLDLSPIEVNIMDLNKIASHNLGNWGHSKQGIKEKNTSNFDDTQHPKHITVRQTLIVLKLIQLVLTSTLVLRVTLVTSLKTRGNWFRFRFTSVVRLSQVYCLLSRYNYVLLRLLNQWLIFSVVDLGCAGLPAIGLSFFLFQLQEKYYVLAHPFVIGIPVRLLYCSPRSTVCYKM